MGAVWFIARSGAARRLAGGLALAALTGLAGGVVLAAWAGARRTDTAYERLAEAVHHADLVVTAEGGPATFDPSVATDGPGVASAGLVNGYAAVVVRPDGTPDLATQTALLAPVDTTAWGSLDRPLLAAGRLPEPAADDEMVVPEALRDRGYPIGSTHDICIVDYGQALAFGEGVLDGTASIDQQRAFVAAVCSVHRLEVVGVTRLGPDEVVLREDSEADLFMQAGPGLASTVDRPAVFSFALVDLEPGADEGAFTDSVLDRASPDAALSVQSAALRAALVDRTVAPYVQALTLFALVAAVAAVGVLGPAVVRWAGTRRADRVSLLALGMRSHQLRLSCAIRGAALGAVAAAVAVSTAVVASSHFPIGIVARIEPHPGLRVDGMVLAAGALLIVAVGAVLGAAATTSTRIAVRRPSRVAEGLRALGAGPSVVSGVHAAVADDGRGAGAARTAGGVAIAIVALVTALTYQAGLVRLLDTPERYGWTWDTVIETGDEELSEDLRGALESDALVEGVAYGRRTSLLRDGAAVQMFSFDTVRGGTHPLILDGRAPGGPDEIALGAQTLDRLDAGIGDTLTFRAASGERVRLTVVGQTLLPLLSLGQDLSVAEGGLLDDARAEQLAPGPVEMALIDLRAGATPDDLRRSLDAQGVLPPGPPQLAGPTFTADLRGYDAVRSTPLVLAGALALLGMGVLAHTITSAGRRRRRELAVLRCLGFMARDLRASVRWHALVVATLCLAVAVPIGVGLGRVLWTSFARGIGVVDDAVTPVAAVVAVVAVTLVGTVALAAVPGRQASRVRPAEVLRSE